MRGLILLVISFTCLSIFADDLVGNTDSKADCTDMSDRQEAKTASVDDQSGGNTKTGDNN